MLARTYGGHTSQVRPICQTTTHAGIIGAYSSQQAAARLLRAERSLLDPRPFSTK